MVLPPINAATARQVLRRLRVAAVLSGTRGQPPGDLGAVGGAVSGLSHLACELGGELAALDINPLICGPSGVVAADVLAVRYDPCRQGR